MAQDYNENMADPKYMNLDEFVRDGYLAEINRQLLHPVGLALEVTIAEDGSIRLSGVWDCRHDPEGIVFEDEMREEVLAKAAKFDAAWNAVKEARLGALGGTMVQWETMARRAPDGA